MAEKKVSGFQTFLAEMLLPMFLQYGKTSALTSLQKAVDENEKQKEMIHLAITSFYPVVDTVLEDAATKSKTKIDDKTIDQIKELLEQLASDNGWELPNLDEAQEDD